MVIQSADISMCSHRAYSKDVKGQTITTRWQAGKPTTITTTVQNFSYGQSEETVYNNYNDFARNMKNKSSHRADNSFSQFNSVPEITRRPSHFDYIEESLNKTLRILLDMLYKSKSLTRNHSYEYNSNSTYLNRNITSTTSVPGTIWHQVTDTVYSSKEFETTSFASTGAAITADGRIIEFDVSFTMSRAFMEEIHTSEFTQYEQVVTDPLIISLDSNPPSLGSQTFYFDIDCDGTKDELSTLGSGCGFLAYDKNNDGTINDGRELFGPQSGRGFLELSQYDLDCNGWIDEADEIYKHLKVWTKDEDGNDKLLNLQDANVGAIYLGSSTTTFSMTDRNNNLNGLMRSSGIFLKENGGAGIISQIDLVRHQEV